MSFKLKHYSILLFFLFSIFGCGGSGGSNNGETNRSWGTAELIEANDAMAQFPQITFDGNGNAIAVWQQFNSIWANYYDGTNWGIAQLIENDDVHNVQYPQIAFDGNGNAIAVWYQYDGTSDSVWANYFDGANWGTAQLIENDNNYITFHTHPQVVFDGNGNAIAVWDQSDGTRVNIYANYFNGTNWGTAELIETDDAGNADMPQIASDGNGNAIAVWFQSDGTSRRNIWANYYDGTSWGAAELIENGSGDAYVVRVAFDTGGNAIAVWQQDDGIRHNIWANYFDGTSWSTAELIETDDAGDAYAAHIVFDTSGNAIVVWNQNDGIRFNIWANYFNGTTWGTAELIETEDSGYALTPRVAFDAGGNAIAVWYQDDGTRYNIWSNFFDGTSWGEAELVEADDAGNASYPQVAFDADGNAIAVWHQDDGTHINICANSYN